MRTMGWLFYVIFVVALFCLFGARCTRDIRPFDYGADVEQAVSLSGVAPVSDAATEETFVSCEAGSWKFACPVGWIVNYTEEGGAQHITVASTEKQIVRGAVLPDDYFEPHGDAIAPDANKYATEYILFVIDAYPNSFEADFSEWFEKIYPGAINEFEPYQVPYQPEVDAMRPKTVQAVIDGEPRFLARANGRVYDVALYFRGVNKNDANGWFNEFLRRFPF